ncbi:MSHA biogenesis protein MshG [Massilia sp. Root133]|jgi:MSHA biogenesis protein MshG|uniref:Type II secretion system F family protein n=1 Tax=Massilia cellulosiltytica TaxID=2683234 RepID=A0A7X3G3D7_9BURK|nr:MULTISPECIES: type II secretion system F family protein [Telluria group]KQY01516.1 MSHA biogenesis protein MshG [Massilia sp. Root133]KQZ48226.1 MSHA biogenesis protein MshG [Massilia sp. Root1485]MVW62234.1 type II secretion system F family protein [Telluria cellulosilytica]
MPFFAYKGRNARGELMQGVLEGADSSAIADQLFGTGVTPLDITPTTRKATTPGNAAGANDSLWERLTRKKVTSIDVQLFSRQIYTLLKSGVPIMRGLAGLQESATNKSFARVIQDLRESLDAGRELSTAMRRHTECFTPFYLSMVRVGEMTGRLEEVFLRLFDHLEFDRDMRDRVKTAMRYPTFVIIAMIAAMVVVNVFVIPQFEKVFQSFHAELPLMTRILITTSRFTVEYWPVMLGAALAAFFGVRAWTRTVSGRLAWDRWKLRFPIAGKIIHKATMARFARSFALSIRSGVPIVQALSVVAQTADNAYLTMRLDQMRDGVERGESILRTATNAQVFTPIVLQMIAVGEESGSLDDLMDEIAQMYEREVDYELKTLSSQIEPILITFLGAMVLVLALGIFLPIWDLGKAALHH